VQAESRNFQEKFSRRGGVRQQIEATFLSLKWVFRLGETLARTLMGLTARIAGRSPPTLMLLWSIDAWVILKAKSRNCGLNLTTQISSTHKNFLENGSYTCLEKIIMYE